jgi:predicted 3-demethylubiquinone-9 3-methyltransferase (glyoxalase superfamily)
MSKIAPCLRSDGTTEEAATLYTSLFPNSRINGVSRSPADNPSTLDGAVLTVDFTLDGQAGPSQTANPAPRRSRPYGCCPRHGGDAADDEDRCREAA